MTRPEAVKHDRIRQLILKALEPGYPTPLDTIVLRRHMANFGYPLSEEDLNSYLAYLDDKELVKIDRRQGGIVLVRLSAKGLDVLDERISVCGVGQEF